MGNLPRRSLLTLLGAAGLTGVTGTAWGAPPSPSAPPPAEGTASAPGHVETFAPPPGGWRAVAEDVRRETQWAWRSYVDRAFGHDQIKPVSGGFEEFFVPGRPMGLTVVEALDTLWLMELDAEFAQGLKWVHDNLDFDVNASFQVFETNIRMLGGLLSAYHVSGDPKMLSLAKDLGDRLLVAFTKSPTGIPYRYVNLRTGAVSQPETNLAETGTYITEFGSLSRWTGDQKYYNAAKKAFKATFDRRTSLNLMPWDVHAETGAWRNRTATVGPPADSYYEYLWDGYRLFGDQDLRNWFTTLLGAIHRYQWETVGGRSWYAQVDAFTGARVSRSQSELASFWAGLMAETGQNLLRGEVYHDSWTAVQDKFGVLPEGISYPALNATSVGNQLRPEYADAALFLWLRTGREKYRERAYTHYQQMKATSKTRYGYTILTDVTTTPKRKGDFCPGYWWSEQLKYYWLLFGDAARFDYRNHYLSTEGNIFLGAKR